MLHADPLLQRPAIVHPGTLARALDHLIPAARSRSEVWQMLTERYTVDLDAVAALLPADDPEPHWLSTRG
jgi:hypothetical protein